MPTAALCKYLPQVTPDVRPKAGIMVLVIARLDGVLSEAVPALKTVLTGSFFRIAGSSSSQYSKNI